MHKATWVIGTFLAVAMSLPAVAQTFGAKNLELIVPFPPGGGADLAMRLIAPRLSEDLKQPVIVINRPGAGGIVATTQYSKAPPDGHTLIHGYSATISIYPALYGEKLSYSPERDLVPVAPVMSVPMFLVVNASVPARSVAEFVALAKSKPGEITFASAGNGSSNQLAGELLKSMAGIEMRHVPYNGSGPAEIAVLGGHVTAMFDSGFVLPYITSGKLIALAVTTAKRLPEHPTIPAVAETYPGFELISWHGLFAPAGTPKAIVDKLNASITKAINTAEVRQGFAASGVQPFIASSEEFARFIRAETQKWGELVRRSGAKVE